MGERGGGERDAGREGREPGPGRPEPRVHAAVAATPPPAAVGAGRPARRLLAAAAGTGPARGGGGGGAGGVRVGGAAARSQPEPAGWCSEEPRRPPRGRGLLARRRPSRRGAPAPPRGAAPLRLASVLEGEQPLEGERGLRAFSQPLARRGAGSPARLSTHLCPSPTRPLRARLSGPRLAPASRVLVLKVL